MSSIEMDRWIEDSSAQKLVLAWAAPLRTFTFKVLSLDLSLSTSLSLPLSLYLSLSTSECSVLN
jgi:hypothetical protein